MGVPAVPGTISYQISQLAAQLMAKQRLPLETLQAQREALSQRASALGTLKTKMLALHAALENLNRAGNLSPFAAKSATSSNPAIAATASSTAEAGTFSVTVSQLAVRATHVSNLYNDAGTSISATGAGTFTFKVTVSARDYDVTVSVNAGQTDGAVLADIAGAVSRAAGAKVAAVRVQTAGGQSQLSLTSVDTGTGGKLTFTDTDGLLGRVGVSHATPTAATNDLGGYIHEDLGNHELDAQLTVNGVTLYRDSNTVTDAISGTTLTLKSGSSTAVTVKIEPDAEQALGRIKDFIAKYNDVIDYLNRNTTIDPKAGTRGSLALDPIFSALAGQLRAREATRVTSPPPGMPNSLAALGVRAAADGKLSVADERSFRDTFRTDPAAVSNVFNGPAGVGGALDRLVTSYSSYNGQIALTQNQLTLRIGSFDAHITRTNGLLAARQARLEDELARGQSLLQRLNAQASQMSRITAILGQFGLSR